MGKAVVDLAPAGLPLDVNGAFSQKTALAKVIPSAPGSKFLPELPRDDNRYAEPRQRHPGAAAQERAHHEGWPRERQIDSGPPRPT